MIVIAILLLAAIAIVTAGVIAGSEQDAVFDVFGETVHASGWEIFALGAACGFALPIAIWLLRVSTRRARLRHREQRELRAAHERQRVELEQQRQELEEEREKRRNGGLVRPYVGSGAPGDQSADTGPGGGPTSSPVGDRTGEGPAAERPVSPSDADRPSGEREPPTARFDVQRPGVRPYGTTSSGLGPPPADSGGFGAFDRPPGS